MFGHQVSYAAGESGPLETSSSRKTMRSMGVARIFQRGGHTVSNRGYSRFCYLNIVGCLSRKRLTKGGGKGGGGHEVRLY